MAGAAAFATGAAAPSAAVRISLGPVAERGPLALPRLAEILSAPVSPEEPAGLTRSLRRGPRQLS